MTPRQAAILLFVWLGVQAVLSAAFLLPYTVLTTRGMPSSLGTRAFALFPIAFVAWLAFRLIRDRERFAAALFPDTPSRAPGADARELAVLGVALIGLYVIVQAAPAILSWLVEVPQALSGGTTGEESALTLARILAVAVAPVTGAVLLANRAPIADWLLAVAPRDATSADPGDRGDDPAA